MRVDLLWRMEYRMASACHLSPCEGRTAPLILASRIGFRPQINATETDYQLQLCNNHDATVIFDS